LSLELVLLSALIAEAGTKYQDGYGEDPTVPLTYPFETIAPTPAHNRKFEMEFGLRLRSMSMPKPILDVWFFDQEDEDWAYIEARPKVRGTAMGLEYGVRGKNGAGIFYAEFVDAGLTHGYWDDVEDPVDHLDGDYLAPSRALGLVTFGANYAYEAHFVRVEDTGGRFGLSMLTGGGLGLGVLAGRLDRWGPDLQGNPSYKRYLDGLPPDSDKQLPRVYPMVDINLGLRADIGSRVVVRLETGLHTLLYYGTSVGVLF
jgi:hypothetical protein